VELNPKDVEAVLRKRKVNFLFHANTVTTSCAYLTHGKLLSRAGVEKLDLVQTKQKSDDVDKKFGIFNYIFLDTVDIHNRARRRNEYGPVVFVFSLDLLLMLGIKSIRVTKTNPIKWDGRESDDKKYFMSIEELDSGFVYGDFGMSLMIEDEGGLPIKNGFSTMLVDNPNLRINGVDIFKNALLALDNARLSGPLKNTDVSFGKRICPAGDCKCKWNYSTDMQWVNRSFLLNFDY